MEADEENEEYEEINQNNDENNTFDEKRYWKEYILNNYIYFPEKCQICKSNNIKIGETKDKKNLYRFVCNNYRSLYRSNLH